MSDDFETADAFLNQLAPHHPDWAPEPRDWIFRGQRDADWSLTPSAYRPAALARFGRPPPSNDEEQRRVEHELLVRFALLADVQGLPTLTSRRALELEAADRWIPERLHAHAALAQHYGVPTRLLDWTRRPFVAAWFAAEGAARAQPQGPAPTRRLAVWALRRRKGGVDLLAEGGTRLIHAPRASNPNLHLQSGLFSLQEERQPLDQLLRGQPILRRLSLPVSEAGRLLGLLEANFVQGATVYAGYEGVTRSLEEEHLRVR